MDIIPAKTPKLLKRIFPNYTWEVSTKEKQLFLTFDDGPTPEVTSWTLEQLRRYGAKATFFCIGNNIKQHPALLQDILNDGHSLGNHTFEHVQGWKTGTDHYIKEALATQELLNKSQRAHTASLAPSEQVAQHLPLFRPPYGKIKPGQGRRLMDLGFKIIMWDVLAFDWKANINGQECAQNVIRNAGPGSIIVFHDSLKASGNLMVALPQVLDHFSAQGYQFLALSSTSLP